MPTNINLVHQATADKRVAELVGSNWKANKDGTITSVIDIDTETGVVRPIIQPKSAPDSIGYLTNRASQEERIFKMRLRLKKKLENKI
jgi:hypothetical protein